jgi:hypothetical protein
MVRMSHSSRHTVIFPSTDLEHAEDGKVDLYAATSDGS